MGLVAVSIVGFDSGRLDDMPGRYTLRVSWSLSGSICLEVFGRFIAHLFEK